MLDRVMDFFRSLLHRKPVRLAIVRRYMDANRNYVGELYLDQTVVRRHDTLAAYVMIGMSLDSLPLDTDTVDVGMRPYVLDTRDDFLSPMPSNRIRVGALDPLDNDGVRAMIARLPKRRMTVAIQNGFIERVAEVKAWE